MYVSASCGWLNGFWAIRGGGYLLKILISWDSLWGDNHWVDDRSSFQLRGTAPQEANPPLSVSICLFHTHTHSEAKLIPLCGIMTGF